MANKLAYKLPTVQLSLHIKEPRGYTPFAFRTPEDVVTYLGPLQHSPNEQFVALHLNSRHEVIALHKVSEGSLSASIVHPREVFKAAMLNNAYAIVVAHNHPSGAALTPSNEDRQTTVKLVDAGKILGINVLDHLIVGPLGQSLSLRETESELWRD